MPLVSTSIPNLLNGVSQQPSSLRQVTQGEVQENALSSVIDGLVKRPPTEHIAEIINNGLSSLGSAIHVIDRSPTNRQIIVVSATTSSASLDIFNIDGTSISVTASSTDLQYLYCANPAQDLQFLTVADYTFVVNKTKTVAMLSDIVAGAITGADNYQEFSDLPTSNSTTPPSVGQIYEVVGSATNAFDNFYVKAVSQDAYEETVRPGIQYKLDPATMPHALVPNSSTAPTSFTLQQNTYNDRVVGDLDSAPNPSFVGKTISNVFFFKNRLGFLSQENVIMSAAGDFFRFFPKTVVTVLADGPIDVSVSHTKVATLKHAIAFNDSLTLFSSQTQFVVENEGALTPQTISIVPSTEFENNPAVRPVGAGNVLYFVASRGEFSSVREYYIQADTVISDAIEITAHVPKYIPKNVVKLATSSNEDILVALSSNKRDRLYVYKWFSDGSQKLQASWSTWVFPSITQLGAILDVTILENDLYMVVSRADGVSIEKISLQYIDDENLPFNARIDRKVTLTGTYDAGTNKTTWTLPYTQALSVPVIAVKSGSWPSRKGANITTTRPTTTTVEAEGDYSFRPVMLGVEYTMNYQFSTQYVRENSGQQSIQSGRLQLRTMRINFEDTGFFKVEVTPEGRTTNTYEYTGVVLNKPDSTIGDVPLDDGTFRFPIQSKNDRVTINIKSDSYLPCAFQNAEWEGFYTLRSNRI